MSILKYAILGLLNRESMTGYDITREFNSNTLANFWYAKHSQVYPELARLVEDDLATCQVMIRGEKMETKLYSITENGRKDLMQWLAEDEPLPPTPKDVFRLRMYFSDFMSPELLKRHLCDAHAKHGIKRSYLEGIMEERFHKDPPVIGTKEYGDFMVLEGAILREDSYIQWLDNCIGRLK